MNTETLTGTIYSIGSPLVDAILDPFSIQWEVKRLNNRQHRLTVTRKGE